MSSSVLGSQTPLMLQSISRSTPCPKVCFENPRQASLDCCPSTDPELSDMLTYSASPDAALEKMRPS